jgi:hypothetical protein
MDPKKQLDLQKRLRFMDDESLMRFGKAAKKRCTAESQYGRPPFQESVAALEHARAEWRRRYPDDTIADFF